VAVVSCRWYIGNLSRGGAYHGEGRRGAQRGGSACSNSGTCTCTPGRREPYSVVGAADESPKCR
jgi:hypothetical protein